MKQTWKYQDHWVHYTKLIETKDMVHSFYYIYSVRWSIPTANIPMALGSASAYFTIKINKNKPPVSSSFSAISIDETSMRMETSLVEIIDDLLCET